MSLPESKVLEKLNAVSTAKRLANMVSSHAWSEPLQASDVICQELHDTDFGKREKVQQDKRKAAESRRA